MLEERRERGHFFLSFRTPVILSFFAPLCFCMGANLRSGGTALPDQTPAVGMERKLAAIFSTDVAGYSRLMGEDEEATIRTLTAYRALVAYPAISRPCC
jgi:hypothetical protein